MSVTRFSEVIGYVPDLNGCRKKIVEYCRGLENTIVRLEQEKRQSIEVARTTNKALRQENEDEE